MPRTVTRLRIFVASPSDVSEERQRLERVVKQLRTHVAAPYGLDLELVRWETHVRPGVGEDAQAVINPQIGTYDLFIGILWNRFGTPTGRADSGTREEFDQAYARWQQDPTGLEIWVYFGRQPYDFSSSEELEQKAKVLAFQKELQRDKGLLVSTYTDPADFEEKVHGHLELFVAEHGSSARTAARPALEEKAVTGQDVVRLQRYLREVWDACVNLKLTTIDIKTATGSREAAELELNSVFTDLDVKYTPQRDDDSALRQRHAELLPEEAAERRLPAMEALSQYPRLVLLGDPGSGKSTLVNFVALCLAGDSLSLADVNRKRLGDSWTLPGLLPVRVILRDYAARGLPENKGLWQFMQYELRATRTSFGESLAGCVPVIRKILEQEDGAIILLDGIDEVPEAERCRVRLKEKVEQFCRDFPHCRVLVTSRPYAYQDPEAWLTGFEVRTLADFGPEQVQTFIVRWYAHVGQKDRALGPVNAERYAKQLQAAIEHNPRLAELAPRPLLLTLMASLHRWREGGSLPEKRQELYEASVGLLIDLWQRPKRIFDFRGRPAAMEYDVWKELGISADRLRAALNLVAYEAHWKQPSLQGTHDIRVRDLVGVLYELSDKGKTGPDIDAGERRIVEYLTNRAGLLVERKQGEIYTLPHRTFQEYLAACYLADEDFPFLLAQMLREDDERWREACLLAAAKAVSGSKSAVWNLVGAFCPRDWPPPAEPEASDYYAALRAAEALIETEQHRNVPQRQRLLLGRLQDWLAALVQGDRLPVLERAAAGRAMAHLGDPRPGVGRRDDGLPDLLWCAVPAGPFTMGSTKEKDPDAYRDELPQHEEESITSSYYISRYPVTNVQFAAFVENGGYTDPRWLKECWTEAGRRWLSERGATGPGRYGAPFDVPNHPVVGVSWYEALAFCRWLTQQLQSAAYEPQMWPSGKIETVPLQPGTFVVRLPAEAEWEKAARGTDGRIYPWGDDFDAARCNMGDTGIGSTSAVGIFPRGDSPYGCADMSGNVLEWCSTRWVGDYSNYDQGVEEREEPEGDAARVLRGGSWYYNRGGVRCAYRFGPYPFGRDYLIGFRVVVASDSLPL